MEPPTHATRRHHLLHTLVAATLIACSGASDPPEPSDDTGADASDAVDDGAGGDVGEEVDATTDSGADVDDGTGDIGEATDGEVDGGDADEPLPTTMTVAARDGSVSVTVQTDPFAFTVHDRDNAVLTGSEDLDATPQFAGLAYARTDSFSRTTFYHPALRGADGAGGRDITWFAATRAVAADAGDDSIALILETTGPDGDVGAPVEFTLTADEFGVRFHVAAPVEESVVYVSISLSATAEEGFFGLGQQFDRVDNRGLIRDMMIQAEGASESSTNEVHVPVPYLISTRRYALFVDSRWPGAFDVAATHADRVRSTWNTTAIEGWFFADPDPIELMRKYTAVTALPAPVPHWSLGPVWWRNRNTGTDEVLSDARRARELGLGGSLMWIDRPWQSYYQNFRFNPVQFPDPEAMYDELRALGYRALLHHAPQINVPGTSGIAGGEDASELLYETYADAGYFVRNEQGEPFTFPWGGGIGAFVDWSNPDAVSAVQSLIPRVAQYGVVGVKMDWDEYLQPNVGPIRLHLSFHNGETNMTMKSEYSLLYHKAMLEGFEAAIGEPGFTLVRHGSQRDQQWSTCVWPGDLDNDFTEHTRGPSEMQRQWNVGGLPAAVVANISLGMSGFPCFASDIGGYRNGQPGEEALLRWMAFGIFNGVMQLGGGGRTHMPWSEDSPYSEASIGITERFFATRMALVPYVHEQLRQAGRDGTPLIRSLWMMHPDEPRAREFERDFWFGPDFVVAPVFTEGATERDLWLPEGEWIDWLTGERRVGGQVVTRPVPIDEFAAHARAGAIIPLLPPEVVALMPAESEDVVSWQDARWLRLRVVTGAPGELHLFNGVRAAMADWSGDEALELSVRFESHDDDLHPEIAFTPPHVVLEIERLGTPLDGADLVVNLTRDGVESELDAIDGDPGDDSEGWWTSEDGRLAFVRVSGDATVHVGAR